MPDFPLTYVWVFLGALMIGFGSGSYVVAAVKNNQIKQMQLDAKDAEIENAKKVLGGFVANVGVINQNSMSFESFKTSFAASNDALRKEFANVTKSNPLPPDCKPDAGRMRSLAASIATANNSTVGR